MKVLHSVGTYLNFSLNWIYPQIFQVPDVQSRVFCDSVVDRASFPIESANLIVNYPPWNQALGLPRLLISTIGRLGYNDQLNHLRLKHWRPQLLHAHFGTRGWESLPII